MLSIRLNGFLSYPPVDSLLGAVPASCATHGGEIGGIAGFG